MPASGRTANLPISSGNILKTFSLRKRDTGSIGLISGECAGQSTTSTPRDSNHDGTILAVWIVALSCWKIVPGVWCGTRPSQSASIYKFAVQLFLAADSSCSITTKSERLPSRSPPKPSVIYRVREAQYSRDHAYRLLG